MSSLLKRIAQIVLWIGVTAGVAFLVARNTSPAATGSNFPSELPVIATSALQTTSLSEQLIAPVISGDGRVIRNDASWLLEATITPESLAYQLLDEPIAVRALISGGPVGFDCAWAGLGVGADGSVTMRCRIPDTIRVVEGLRGSMVLQLETPTTAAVLPLTAVIGAAVQGQVIVVLPDGSTKVRTVSLGVSDPFFIEITSGLEPGELVLAYPTQLDIARASH